MTNYAAISTEENNIETQLETTATEVLIDIDRAHLACITASVDHIESSKGMHDYYCTTYTRYKIANTNHVNILENIVNPQVEKLEATGIIFVDMGTLPAEESSSNCQTDISKGNIVYSQLEEKITEVIDIASLDVYILPEGELVTNNLVDQTDVAEDELVTNNLVDRTDVAEDELVTNNLVDHTDVAEDELVTNNLLDQTDVAEDELVTNNLVDQTDVAEDELVTNNVVDQTDVAEDELVTNNLLDQTDVAEDELVTNNLVDRTDVAEDELVTNNLVDRTDVAEDELVTNNLVDQTDVAEPRDTSTNIKKRKRGVGPWVRVVRKERTDKKNRGDSYVTVTGKHVAQRMVKETLKPCRSKCADFFTFDVRQTIFQEYWSLGTHDRRTQYISGLVTCKNTMTTRKRNEDSAKSRQVTYTYHLEYKGERRVVCKTCFMDILDEKEKFVRIALTNKGNHRSGITDADKRGRKSPGNKKTEHMRELIINHINSFPQYESHYTRRDNINKYLPNHLSLKKMYELYREAVTEPVSRTLYEEQFHKMKLKFKERKTDTCHKCDVYKMKLEVCDNEEQKQMIVEETNSHHEAADLAYNTKKEDKARAQIDPSIKCYTFDLQQCLPTPDLETSVAFYKRLYWTYNLTIHDCATGKASCYLWHETLAKRGANEIASCLYKEIMDLPDSVKKIILYSDTCGGQNKNSHVAAMFTYLLQQKNTIEEIHHKFLIPGHTRMECDADHSLIEKKKKKSATLIAHPHDWSTLIRCTSNKFKIVEMEQNEFLDFAELLKGPLVQKHKNNSGERFLWRECQWLIYGRIFGQFDYSTSLKSDTPFKRMSLRRRGRGHTINVTSAYTGPLPITKEKKKDILDLIDLIPPVFHQFYRDLPISLNIPEIDPDLEEIDPEI
ncbi:uncharacterized protein LOC126890691 isoform X1 [Diabrotica virgifera virgifera]|uniref:DUF7869 domain-containing protein n=1 Tax=Diabrotica virgifera virgifera TaxID=50390 RepID=A0ABM5L032_DIAVI|nr:uncharacterized protein LOC126890691 isoform X1 [Diabrotica virgifera virgifera]